MAQKKQTKTSKAADKKAARNTSAKKAAAKKAPAKKAAAKKAPTKSPAKKAATSKTPAKKAATSKTPANKFVAKRATGKSASSAIESQISTSTGAIDGDVIWSVFQGNTTDVSATVNGKVIYANDVKPANVKKRFLAWFKR